MADLNVLAAPTRRLADAVIAAGRVRLPLDGLLASWDVAMPELRSSEESHVRLVDALHELSSAGVVNLPAVASWDRTRWPALPKFVTVPAARRPPRATPWRTFPWRDELGWAASMPTLTEGQYQALVAVNDWLTAGGDTFVVPARVRSAELWGDEKLIDSIVDSSLWGPGRLSWDVIRAERLPPPLVIRRVGAGTELLVVENIDPFWLCAQLLAGADSPIGRVAWGAGKAFIATAPSIAEEPDVPTRIWYWGDGDPEGVRIPTLAAPVVDAAGLPPLEPALPLWEAYAEVEVRKPGEYNWSTVPSDWLGPHGWGALGVARSRSGKVAQEAIGRSALEAILQ